MLCCSYFQKRIHIYCEFIPQIIFLCFLFLYMVILMFVKWVAYGPIAPDVKTSPYCAPSILITFINMVLFKKNEAPAVCDKYMYGGQVSTCLCANMMLINLTFVFNYRKSCC